jgi:hypothetical protein
MKANLQGTGGHIKIRNHANDNEYEFDDYQDIMVSYDKRQVNNKRIDAANYIFRDGTQQEIYNTSYNNETRSD